VVSRQVNALTEAGMVERIRDPRDGRAWLVSMTPPGREALAKIWDRRRQWFASVLAGFEPHELASATKVVCAIHEAWDAVDRRPDIRIPREEG
jgi:DNA-binding MarR family transcriptional regulator